MTMTDAPEAPEECSCCGTTHNELTRYLFPPEPERWLCPYCAEAFSLDDTIVKSMAAMFNVLESRLRQ